jgi:hypothetical protein
MLAALRPRLDANAYREAERETEVKQIEAQLCW